METARTALILLMSKQPNVWTSSSLMNDYEFQICADAKDVIKTLQNIRCDLSILDADLFGDKTIEVVQEFKRLFPSVPIILLSDDTSQPYRAQVLEAGIDAVLTKSAPPKELRRFIQVLFQQHQQNRSLAQLNQKLRLLASLPRLLYGQSDTYSLLLQAIKLLRSVFRLYGVAVLFQEGDVFRLYAGSEEISNRHKLYESILRPDRNDPFLWTIRTGVMQIYEDISRNPNYACIPILGRARAATIMPLVHERDIAGAIGIFLADGEVIGPEDLVIYEQFAAHLIAALRNVYQYQAQSVSVRSSQHLLKAWQRLISSNSADELGRDLCRLVEDMPVIGQAVVWLNTNAAGVNQDILVDTQDGTLVANLNPYSLIFTEKLTGVFNETLQPVLIERNITQDRVSELLFDLFQTRQLIVVPIADSVRFLGSIIAEIADGQTLDVESINLLKNLSYTAGVLFERTTLTNVVEDKSSRLEAILCSISEGIFVVEDDQVAFCNPQVAELTSINSSKILCQPSEVLLRNLSEVTDTPAQNYDRLLAAKKAVVEQSNGEDYYPVVELTLPNQERDLNIEFVKTVSAEHQRVSWIGIIRDNSQLKYGSQIMHLLASSMADSLRLPYAQVRSLISTLAEHHGRFNYRERDALIGQIRVGIDQIGGQWDNLLEVYNLQIGNVVLDRQVIDIQPVVQRVVETIQTGSPRKQIRLTAEPNVLSVKADEFRFERAISTIIQRVVDAASPDHTTEIKVERQDQEVLITVQETGHDVPIDKLEQLFAPAHLGASADRTDYGLYLAREIISRHGGRVLTDNNGGEGTVVKTFLPAVGFARAAESKEAKISHPDKAEDTVGTVGTVDTVDTVEAAVTAAVPKGVHVPRRVPRSVIFIEGQSSIAQCLLGKLKQDYEVLTYRSGEEALKDVNMIHVDLVVIDTMSPEDNCLDLCRQLRKFTEVPIMLIADKAPDTGKVQGLNAGADDYITAPISEEELLARVQVIFKREHVPQRTSEPLAIGNLYINFARREVFISNKPVALTRIEFDLLYTLITNRETVLTHRQLLEKVWGPDYANETHYLWVSISRLRKKLEAKDDTTHYIHNQPGVGYFFNAA